MEGDDLEIVVDALAELLLEPARVLLVQSGAELLRHRVVRGVADQDVAEAKAVVGGEEGAIGAEELLANEAQEMHADAFPHVDGEELRDRAAVEQPPFDGCSREYVPLLLVQPVDPGRQERLDRRRDDEFLVRSFRLHGEDVLDEERVPLGCRDDPLARVVAQVSLAFEVPDQPLRLVVRQRLERNEDRVRPRRGPRWPDVEQVRPREAEQEDRGASREADHVLEQVEQCGLGPVNVIQHDHERLLATDCFEQLPERPGDFLGRSALVRRAHRDSEALRDRLGVVLVRNESCERAFGVGDLVDDLRERGVSDRLAVGEAPADDDACVCRECTDHLVREP